MIFFKRNGSQDELLIVELGTGGLGDPGGDGYYVRDEDGCSFGRAVVVGEEQEELTVDHSVTDRRNSPVLDNTFNSSDQVVSTRAPHSITIISNYSPFLKKSMYWITISENILIPIHIQNLLTCYLKLNCK